ncbi:hypothetical protein [Oceanobacter mangrovi]|uniref:hypothetical protein n=1 Tax=Oceanobacter mangrovi TaxID=2862510 RepID=UPI001C8D682D|nr:hypothetical protein [Oceanobacter mangrovi]
MIESMLVFLLVLTGTAAGWFLGSRSARSQKKLSSPDWIPSVELIFSQNSDAALKRLVNAQTLDEDTVDLFLKLGRSLREKGEVERAIHLHQTLFARTDLPKPLLQSLELELAMDYAAAGLHDRAERLLVELLEGKGQIQEKAATSLIRLLEEEGEWLRILELAAGKRFPMTSQLQRRIAHAACEMAEKASTRGDFIETRNLCRQALKVDSGCARAFVVLGNMAYSQHEFHEAIRCYLKALEIDSGCIISLLEKMVDSFHQVDDYSGLLAHLKRHNVTLDFVPALVAKAEAVARVDNTDVALQTFISDLESHPSYRGYVAMLGLMLSFQRQLSESQAHGVYDILQRINASEAAFVCGHCGFKARQFHWRCPSCKDWASLKAISPTRVSTISIDDL